MTTKSFFTFVCLGFAATVFAQPDPPILSLAKKVATDARLNGIIENQNGNLVAVGSTYVAGQRRDALWILLEKNGTILSEKTINGHDRNDEAFAVRQTLDGGYALAGATQTRENGKTDAWFVKTDAKGVTLLSKQFGSIGNDAFFDITEDDDGNIYAVGHQNGVLFLVKMDKRGTAIFQKTYDGTAIQNAALTWLSDGKLAIIGAQSTESRLKCVDTEGAVLWQKTLENVVINALKRDRSGGLVMAGVGVKVKKNAEDMVVIRVDASGNQADNSVQYFGGEGRDGAQSLALDTEGAVYLVGNTTSMKSGGARAADFCLFKINGKERAWKQPISWGKEGIELGFGVTVTQSGGVFAVGEQAGDAVIIGLNEAASPKINGPSSLRIDRTNVIDDGNDNGILEENERGAVVFTVKNEGQNDLADVVVTAETTGKGVVFSPKINLGWLRAGESRRVGIPLSISPTIRAENGQMTIQLKAKNGSNTAAAQVGIPTQVSDKVDLAVAGAQFSSTPIRRNQKLTVQVTIRNLGRKMAQGVRVSCLLPNDILCLSNGQPTNSPRFELGDMATNSSKTVSFDVKIPSFYREDSLIVKLSMREIGGSTLQQKELKALLLAFEKDNMVGQMSPKDSVVVQWLSPFVEDLNDKKLDYFRRPFSLKIKALSNQPLTEQSFKLWVNGKLYDHAGSKSDNIRLKANGTAGGYRFAFTYIENIELIEGENHLYFEVQNASGKAKSEEITVNKRLVKPTLHVLAVGVPHPDLQFTTNDAADFAKVCAAQEGKFFDKVNIVLKNTPEATTVDALRRTLKTLQLDFLETNAIKPDDLVIVFISSHGKSDKRSSFFKIAASDLAEAFVDKTCLDFKEDILEVLKPINCKKLILLDACQSGAIATDDRPESGAKSMEADISSAIQRFLDTESDLVCITSSNRNELSYEDEKWQNGAFTEAVMEALTNATVSINGKKSKADKDNDGLVELQELYDFISLRIPQMVQDAKKKPQTPQLKDANRTNFPIFYVR
jgi:hypothetical protein